MEVIRDIDVAREMVNNLICAGKTTGLVPTMGALHAGHLSLVRRSVLENDLTIATIFVNPIQFNDAGDLAKYPSHIEADLEKLREEECDIVFIPAREEMYPEEPVTQFRFGHLEGIMEGKHRPDHFNGVAIVVLKLLNIFTPRKAYFGQKDLQQFKIIELVVRDLSINVDLVMMPIIREESGLAMSSRNERLSTNGRLAAAHIYRALKKAQDEFEASADFVKARKKAEEYLEPQNDINIEYLDVAYLKDLKPVKKDTRSEPLVLCFAGYVEGIRLIDNQILGR